MASGQTLGVIDIVWNGVALDVENKSGKLTIGGWKQNPVLVQGKVKWSREFEASEITATITLARDVDPATIWADGQAELQCNCDTGQSFTFPDAFLTNRPNMSGDGSGGKMEVKWAAGAPETLLNG